MMSATDEMMLGYFEKYLAQLHSREDAIRWAGARNLGNLGALAITAIPQLESIAEDPANDGAFQLAATVSLFDISGDKKYVVRFLPELMKHSDPLIRASAIDRIIDHPLPFDELVAPLVERLGDSDDDVRLTAIRALGRFAVLPATQSTPFEMRWRTGPQMSEARLATCWGLSRVSPARRLMAHLTRSGTKRISTRRFNAPAIRRSMLNECPS
jgi:hypothetical protein